MARKTTGKAKTVKKTIKKKVDWYAYGGRPSDMQSLIPKANFGQTIGSIGDTNIAKNLDMVIPGLGTGVDALMDLGGFFGDKKAYSDAKELSTESGEFINAVESGPVKGTLEDEMSATTNAAQGNIDSFSQMAKPSFGKDFLLPTVMSVAESAAGGGLGDMSKLSGSKNLLSQVSAGGEGAGNAASMLAKRSSSSGGTGLMMEDVWAAGIQGPARPDGTYAMGGTPKSDVYEAEGNEVIQHEPGAPPGTTGQMEPIGNNPMLSELKGKSHGSGGELVDSTGQQIVYSTKLKSKTWGLSFADAAKKIGLKIESFEKSAADGDHITKTTAQSMIKSWTIKLQELQAEQDSARKEKFTSLLQDGASFEELQQNFPDLTQQFMQSQGQQQQQQPEGPTASMEQQFLYGGIPKYAYGDSNPNEPPFYSEQRTDEEVETMQNTFLNEGGMQVYSEDQGIKDYIKSVGLEEFGNQWLSNMDPELLEMAGITSFNDVFANGGEKLKMLQTIYNEKNADQPGFKPIPVDKGVGKFGEHSMSMAGWKELEDSATQPGPINPNLGDIDDPLKDDDGITEDEEFIFDEDSLIDIESEEEEEEEEEIITNMPDVNVTPPDDDEIGDDDGGDMPPIDLIGEDESGPRLKPITIDKIPETNQDLELRKDPNLTLNPYQGVKLPPNTQEEGYTPPPYMGDAPYTDIVADEAGVPLEPGPGGGDDPFWTGGYFTGQDLPDEKEIPPYMGDAPYTDIVADEAGVTLEPGPKKKREKWKAKPTEDKLFGPFGKNYKEDRKKKEEEIDTNLKNNDDVLLNPKATSNDKMQAFNSQKFFGNLSKYISPFYNFMKSKEGAEVEKKQVNPYEKQLLKDMDQRVDIQPWLNQNMMGLKGGMDFTKDMASGNPMQMFSMYNRLNQGKLGQDSAAWKYKHDAEGKLKTARANQMYNLGEQDRTENVRVAGINSQNRAAVDKYVSTALEQISAIGQLDEYTANLMENDKLRASFINAMAPDLQKYMKDNPELGIGDAVSNVVSGLDQEQIQEMINKSVGEVPTNINITPANNNQNITNEGADVNTNQDVIDASQVLSGDYTNPLDQASNNVTGVGTPVDVDADATFDNAFSVEVNGELFTPIEGESNKYTYQDQTYVKIKQGDTELFITEEEAISKGLLTEDDLQIGEDLPINNSDEEYTPVWTTEEQGYISNINIDGSTGAGAAAITRANGDPITAKIKGKGVTVDGVRIEGEKIYIDLSGLAIALSQTNPSQSLGHFEKDDSTPSGWKWTPDTTNWPMFIDGAPEEDRLTLGAFANGIENDPRVAQQIMEIIQGDGTLKGSDLTKSILNKPE